METEVRGRAVLPALARIYPQLYLVPGTDSAALYDDVVLRGEDAPTRSLAHFTMDDGDSLVYESTPAGEVPVITLRCRADFELFLQIMACRCTPKPIPRTQGASTLDGVVNWTKIRAHKARYLLAQGDGADWEAEFKRFTSDRANYRDVLIVLSEGPYSAVPAQRAGYPESEWLRLSHTIRKTHECTHVLCRRLFPDKKDAVWDELVADAAGTGRSRSSSLVSRGSDTSAGGWKTTCPRARTAQSSSPPWPGRSTIRCFALKLSRRRGPPRDPMTWRSGWRRRSNAGISHKRIV